MARNINYVRLSVEWNTVRSKKGIQTKLRVGLFTCKTFISARYRFRRLGILLKTIHNTTYAIIDHLMYIVSLKSTTNVDFGRETWIKNYFKDYS